MYIYISAHHSFIVCFSFIYYDAFIDPFIYWLFSFIDWFIHLPMPVPAWRSQSAASDAKLRLFCCVSEKWREREAFRRHSHCVFWSLAGNIASLWRCFCVLSTEINISSSWLGFHLFYHRGFIVAEKSRGVSGNDLEFSFWRWRGTGVSFNQQPASMCRAWDKRRVSVESENVWARP